MRSVVNKNHLLKKKAREKYRRRTSECPERSPGGEKIKPDLRVAATSFAWKTCIDINTYIYIFIYTYTIIYVYIYIYTYVYVFYMDLCDKIRYLEYPLS